MIKAIALLSGGLDSILAVRLLLEQGIGVEAVNFLTVFCTCTRDGNSCLASKTAAEQLGIPLKVFEVSREYLELIKSPKHGYGSNINPCLDCRIFMFKKAGQYMRETGADFIITGEVLGQRPMSQHKRALQLIEKESGLEGLVVRPLSARLLSETIPEKKGWVCRDKLLDFAGRTRRPQIALAQAFNIKDYPCAAGGCLLTDPQFARKVKDLLRFGELNLRNAVLLKIGRHFRLSEKAKLVVGRDEKENMRLADLAREGDCLFMPQELAGPTALGRGVFDEELLRFSCSALLRYCDTDGQASAGILCRRIPEEGRLFETSALEDARLATFRI